MKETLINKYLKIEPVQSTDFVQSSKDSYEEIGIVIAKDEIVDIPIGARVFFDSYMVKKYPVEGEVGKWQWYVHVDEVVKYEVS